MKKLYGIIIFFFVISSLVGYSSEFLKIFRSSNWNSLIEIFNRQKERKIFTQEEHYLFAKAFEKERKGENQDELIKMYLLSAGIDCNPPFLECVKNYGSVKGYISNLALYHLQKILDNDDPLKIEILKRADFTNTGPVARNLYSELLKFIHNRYESLSNLEKQYYMKNYVDKYNFDSAIVNLFKARIYKKNNLPDLAQNYYFYTAGKTSTLYILKAIFQDIYSDIKDNKLPKNLIRKLTFFYFHPLAREKIEKFTVNQILYTTNAELVFYDGMYFIETNDSSSLYKLANQTYSYISQNPEILYLWISKLYDKKQYYQIHVLMSIFSHVKKYHQKIWVSYINALEEMYNYDSKSNFKNIYFNEILEYLNVYHYSIQIYDKLMSFLLKRNKNNKLVWEEKIYWDTAAKKLSNQTEAGRFFFWYYRYYKDQLKDLKTAESILEDFYYLSPGNYYIHYVWEIFSKRNNTNYIKDWNDVVTRKDYMRWITKHGWNPEAIQFLSKQNKYQFYDSKSLEVQSFLNEILRNPNYYYVDKEIIFYTKYGEFNFAFELFSEKFKDKLTNINFLKYLIFTGIQAENLFIEVHNLRKLLWELNIPEDPFSLPPIVLNRLYPRPYLDIVKKYANLYGISENIIYALIRQESAFREDAISNSGAMGLMQIMPRTGKWLAKNLKIKQDNLLNPEISIHLGTKYFSDLMKKYKNNFHYAAIAYNGGGGNLKKWMKEYYKGDFYLFLEELPVEESRNYCRKTYQNYLHYKITKDLYEYGIR